MARAAWIPGFAGLWLGCRLPPFDGAQILCGFFTPLARLYGHIARLPLYWVASLAAAIYLIQAYYAPIRGAVEAWLPYSPLFR